ncbi:DUF2637 domain-containing protein, partial [Streptomyces sp. KAI-27]|nr:DUF2637 domain-containing protein [Streptomyces sp. KAI-27]
VDLLLVAAWRRLRSGDAKAAGWCWFLIALAASLGANVATAGLLDLDHVPAWLRVLVAGWPAVAFLGGTLLVHSSPTTHDGTSDAVGQEVPEDIEDQEDAPDPAPEPPAPPAVDSAPTPTPVPAPAPVPVAVPAALVEHARKVAAEHRARTGTAIDTPTLRARLGVPPPMADAIAAQL